MLAARSAPRARHREKPSKFIAMVTSKHAGDHGVASRESHALRQVARHVAEHQPADVLLGAASPAASKAASK